MTISVMPMPPRCSPPLSWTLPITGFFFFSAFDFFYVVEIRGHVGEKDGHLNPISSLILVIELDCSL